MRAIVGGRIRLLLSGGAPLSPDTHDFVRCALCLPLVQGYGLTESCACGNIMVSLISSSVFSLRSWKLVETFKNVMVLFQDSDDWSTGAAGPPLQGVQIRLINWDEGNYTVEDEPNPRGKKVLSLSLKY